ncbi:MAG: anthranilate synthase component I [Gammaproteobacteria bacterium]|nr:MAG: anthranilate synthase component I [Gammaproteobacteria bacterium]
MFRVFPGKKRKYSRVPMVREVFADLDTPLSAYMKLAEGDYTYLFESVQGGEKWGRYSIIGLSASEVYKFYDKTLQVWREGVMQSEEEVDDPLQWISERQAAFTVPSIKGLPRFTGGLVGYFGYETVGYIEPRLKLDDLDDEIHAPDILLMLSEEVVVFDNLSGKLYLVVYVDPQKANAEARGEARLNELVERLKQGLPEQILSLTDENDICISETDFKSGMSQQEFERAVERAKQYIVDGDIMQVVLSQRLSIPFNESPLNLYRVLRSLNPSPYMYYLNLGDMQIVGASPEILVRLEDQKVTVRPIAGTRRRGRDEEEDRAMERELMSDPKERAEHIMLIDLGRNDVGRVARTGTVEVNEQMVVERYSHVMHIVSNVTAELKEGMDAMDVLRATFPAGTVSGAPKIRAMEIIHELEPVKRGVYSGAVGYLGWDGAMDTAIAIRTAVIKDGQLYIQAGAGIVADSIPEMEWKETMNKGRAIFRAVALMKQQCDE